MNLVVLVYKLGLIARVGIGILRYLLLMPDQLLREMVFVVRGGWVVRNRIEFVISVISRFYAKNKGGKGIAFPYQYIS